LPRLTPALAPFQAVTSTGKVPVVPGISTGLVTLSNRHNVYTASIDASGNYNFQSVNAGIYALKAEIAGYNQVNTITVDASSTATVTVADLAIGKYTAEAGNYSYTWVQDQSYAGLPKTEVAQNIVKPVSVAILGKAYEIADISYAQELYYKYGIVLSNENVAWSQEYAYRLYAVLGRIPQITGSDYKYNSSLTPTRWTLTNDAIAGDIDIGTGASAGTIRISTAAFTYAAPLVAEIDGVRGLYFSKRLHHALVNYVTNKGTNQEAVAKILMERFGLTIDTDAQPLNYALFTSEESSRFQNWFKHPSEIIEIINNFEELPEGMHKIPGFKWLVRRLDGTVNPTFPAAPAIAWSSGYLEFMESAYKTYDNAYIARLILHEKAHYIYQFILTKPFKKEWAELGGWQYAANPTNPDYDATNGWQTTKTTEFVSAYAHGSNPNEDFAETLADFVKNPDIVKARSTAKYNFIRDMVMHSNSYVSIIRPDLTFTVLNLYPSYEYPGKIKRITTSVTGDADEDKTLTIEFEITPFSANADPATAIRARIFSPVSEAAPVAVWFDMYFNAANAANTIFRGTQTLSKHLRAGFWQMPNVTIINSVGLERYESSLLYGFKCYLNNPLEDIVAPQVQPNTSSITVKAGTLAGRPVQIATVKFGVTENTGLNNHSAALGRPGAYSLGQSGTSQTLGSGERTIDFYIREYDPSGRYTLNQIALKDFGLNLNYTYFRTSNGNADGTTVHLDENAPSIDIVTPNPDSVAPELDVNRISIKAVPTNLTTPDGETLVTIKYFARDNISGYGSGSNFLLRDPQGILHHYYHYHRNFYTDYFIGDPTAWEQYTSQVILPRGSVPGIWGLLQMTLVDKAGMGKSYKFSETVRFDPNSTAAADLQITQDPIGKSFLSGESIILSVKTVGGDKLTYEWFKDGVSLITGKTVSSMVVGETSAANTPKPDAATYTSAGTPTLQIIGAGQAEAGSYYCIVSNASGREFSKAVDLVFSTQSTAAPSFITQPSSLTLSIGAAGSFAVSASGTPTPTYQWRKDAVNISGATSATYTIGSVTADDAGSYTAVATNSIGAVTSNAATLTVEQSFQVTGPVNPNEPFVRRLYRGVFWREPTAGELAAELTAMAGGRSQAEVLTALLASVGYEATQIDRVIRLYYATFNRMPDRPGLHYWAGVIASGQMSATQVAAAFASASEFGSTYGSLNTGSFVAQIYRNTLGRDPDPAGLDYWTALLNGGFTRGEALLAFADSDEFKTRMAKEVEIVRLYTLLFQRMPTGGDLANWLAFLRGEDQTELFLDSAEFASLYPGGLTNAQFVQAMFTGFLLRGAEQASVDYFAGQLTAGSIRRPELIGLIVQSGEYQTIIAPVVRYYLAVFLRPPDPAGAVYWTGQMRGGLTPTQLSQAFAGSGEFAASYAGLTNLQFVAAMYVNILGRSADESGLDYWAGLLDSGQMTQAGLLRSFVESVEADTRFAPDIRTTLHYQTFLSRTPSRWELDFWNDYLTSLREQLRGELLQSDEFGPN
jgi:hypothetical protein